MRLSGPANVASTEFGGSPFPAAKIAGKGEMAQRIRSFAWASTPLGPLEHWSRELVAIVNLILCSPTPARMLWGPELVLIYNDSYSSIPGRRHPDALGKSAREVFKDAWNVVGPVLETAYATGEPFVFDKRRVPIETGQGVKEFYLDCTYSPIYEDGKVAGLLGLFHDVTGEVTAFLNRDARLNAIYSTSLAYLVLLTPDGILVDCNRAFLEFAGNGRADVVGKHFADSPWFTSTPGAPLRIRGAIDCANAGETVRFELALRRPNGETVTLDFSLTPVRDAHGEIEFLVPEGRDITEVKRTELALLQSEKLAAVGRLASSIAHEINNPLESVMNLIYLARNASPSEAKGFLDLADQEIRRVSIIANQTLRFHKQASKPQAASAADLFSTVMSIYEGRLHNARVRVEKRFRADQPVVCFPGRRAPGVEQPGWECD